jgi:hypothetical protein
MLHPRSLRTDQQRARCRARGDLLEVCLRGTEPSSSRVSLPRQRRARQQHRPAPRRRPNQPFGSRVIVGSVVRALPVEAPELTPTGRERSSMRKEREGRSRYHRATGRRSVVSPRSTRRCPGVGSARGLAARSCTQRAVEPCEYVEYLLCVTGELAVVLQKIAARQL